MSKEITYLKQLFFKNFQLFVLSFIVYFISFSSDIMFKSFGYILIGFLAVATVLVMMDYQYRRQSIDFYYSLPMERKKIFWIHAAIALFNIIFPYIVVLLCMASYTKISNSYFLIEIAFVLPLLIVSSLVFIAITAFSNSRIDSVLLCLLYPIVLYVALGSIYNMVYSNYFYGLDIGTRRYLNYILSFLLIEHGNVVTRSNHIISFGIGFIVQSVIWIVIANYFIQKRKVEYAGVGNLELRRYQYVRVLATLVMFLGITAITYFISDLDAYTLRNVQDVLKFGASIVANGFVHILIGFVFYLIISFIAQRKIDKVFNHIIQYILIFVSFLSLFIGVTLCKKWFFEDKMPTVVNRVQFRYEEKQFESDFIPRILYHNRTQEFNFESEAIKAEALKLHQKLLDKRRNSNNIHTRMEIIYNSDTALQLKRAYYLDYYTTFSLTKMLLDPSGEFASKIYNLIEKNKNIKLHYQFQSKVVSINQKESLNQFITYYFKNFKPEMEHNADKKIFEIELGDYKVEFTIYESDSDMQQEINKLFLSLK